MTRLNLSAIFPIIQIGLKPWILSVILIILSGCSNLPLAIQQAPEPNIDIQQVQQEKNNYNGAAVRWGGTVINVENQQNSSWIQVLYYPLKRYGRPVLTQPAQGRFIIYSKQFLDPAVYTNGTQITVAGNLEGNVHRDIGKKSVELPVVNLTRIHIWPNYNRYGYYGYPYYYPYPRYYYGFYGRPFLFGRGFLGCY